MTFNTTSFMAGAGTVFAAVVLGFVGGAMITSRSTVEPNRVERVAATASHEASPAPTPEAPRTDAAAGPTTVTTKAPVEPAAASDKPPAPADRVISLSPASSSPQPSAAETAKPMVARDDSEDDAAKTVRNETARNEELRKAAAARAAERRAERRRERRKRDLQAAENAVMQMQREDSPPYGRELYERPRVGFSGND
jgi:hypothetical protein